MDMWTNTSGKRYYLTAEGDRVVEEGDERARTLFVGVDGQIPLEDAERYGLTGAAEKAKAAQPNKAKSPPENK